MNRWLLPFLVFIAMACSRCGQNDERLPVLRDPNAQEGDTSYPTIADFSFIDQDSNQVTNSTFSNKIYVADFIFLSCPTICPKMNVEMLRVYKAFEKNDRVLFLSHTIDSVNDSIPRLKAYAQNIGVSSAKWHFVTGNTDSIFSIAEKSYFTSIHRDSLDKNNYIHGGGLVLIDGRKLIRGVYDGTNSTETERLIKDIKTLLKE